MTRVDNILDVIDAGLQTPLDPDNYSDVGAPTHDGCLRCIHADRGEGSDFCGPCRSFMLGDTGTDPAAPPVYSARGVITSDEAMRRAARAMPSLRTTDPDAMRLAATVIQDAFQALGGSSGPGDGTVGAEFMGRMTGWFEANTQEMYATIPIPRMTGETHDPWQFMHDVVQGFMRDADPIGPVTMTCAEDELFGGYQVTLVWRELVPGAGTMPSAVPAPVMTRPVIPRLGLFERTSPASPFRYPVNTFEVFREEFISMNTEYEVVEGLTIIDDIDGEPTPVARVLPEALRQMRGGGS